MNKEKSTDQNHLNAFNTKPVLTTSKMYTVQCTMYNEIKHLRLTFKMTDERNLPE